MASRWQRRIGGYEESMKMGTPDIDSTVGRARRSRSPAVPAPLALHKAHLENVSRLVRNTAHSVNNVLAVSRGNALLLRASAADDDSRAMLDDVLLSLDVAEALSASLVAAANHEPFCFEPVDMSEFLEQLVPSLRDTTGLGEAIQLQVPKVRARVLTDRHYLDLALHAMVRNSVEAAGQDCTLDIKCSVARPLPSRQDGSGRQDFVDIVFRDNGAGFSAQARVRAFQAGFSTRGRGHAGLGLWLVRQVALVSGGDARVINRPAGKGATVAMRLPMMKD